MSDTDFIEALQVLEIPYRDAPRWVGRVEPWSSYELRKDLQG